MPPENPRKWRYTWEAQSHLPILKLFLFTPNFNPSSSCNDLNVDLKFEKSLLEVTWKESQSQNVVSLLVPLPRVLVDLDSPVNFRALEDHIEVKIGLLLPVDHPIVSSFISELNSGDEIGECFSYDGFIEPLSMDSDFKTLSSKGEVDFYCRNCVFKLTKRPTRCLVELPSINWTDVADNWFGACCCSFGEISDKLVNKYVQTNRCAEGTFLLTSAAVILCKDDVAGFKSPEVDQIRKGDGHGFTEAAHDSDCHSGIDVCCATDNPILHNSSLVPSVNLEKESDLVNKACAEPAQLNREKPLSTSLGLDSTKDATSECHCCAHNIPEVLKKQDTNQAVHLEADQKSFLNCYLGNAFVFKSSSLSKDIDWIDFACPQCSCILGAYPSAGANEPLDGGIRLLKCYISLSPSSDSPDDLFRKYTLERMFTNQLLDSAKDELSFRTVVKDLKNKSPMLHIVLLNPNSWCCTGYCSEDSAQYFVKMNLHPVVKVLFSHGHGSAASDPRWIEQWDTKNRAEEMYMLGCVIKELINSIECAKDAFPPSFNSHHGLSLSHIPT
uniref:Ubiquitin-conjugating enzyme E2C-binding protein n=1 Tax=Opuntia streptacantha TaxID=393608 RepID=A0A7C9E4B8_OPUST